MKNSKEKPGSTTQKFWDQDLKCEDEDWGPILTQCVSKVAHSRQAEGIDRRDIEEEESRSGVYLDEWRMEREESIMSLKLGDWMSGSQTGKNRGRAGLMSRKESWIRDLLSAIPIEMFTMLFYTLRCM